MQYDHMQRAPLWLILLAAAGIELVAAVLASETVVTVTLSISGAITLLIAASFAYLRVRAEGPELVVEFGPLAVFRKRIRYDDVVAVRTARSGWIDGWGIHWIAGRGWIWNLWGRDCVEVELRGGRVRIGTDDPTGLARHLEEAIVRRGGRGTDGGS